MIFQFLLFRSLLSSRSISCRPFPIGRQHLLTSICSSLTGYLPIPPITQLLTSHTALPPPQIITPTLFIAPIHMTPVHPFVITCWPSYQQESQYKPSFFTLIHLQAFFCSRVAGSASGAGSRTEMSTAAWEGVAQGYILELIEVLFKVC
jgi:hypothetical protein